jgi:3-dehydroquinate dehydratase-2
MRNRVAVMHGVNFDVIERRPAELYGGMTLMDLERQVDGFARELGLDVRFFQTNHEGNYVEELHRVADYADALVLNPGAWTHYAWSIRDALEVSGLPSVEVHLSDVHAREAFRGVSVLEGACLEQVAGQGVEGYRAGLARLREVLAADEAARA